MKGKLIVFSGPSGVGKGTIRKKLKFKDYIFSISSTTRKIRDGEANGIDYNFITKNEFLKKVSNKQMLEHAEFCDNYYGTERNFVNQLLEQGKNVFLEIECQGSIQVLEQMPDAISIFVLPPSLEELEHRLVTRGTEKRNIIDLRLKKAKEEILLKQYYKYNVINDDIKTVCNEIDDILFKETNV